MKWLFLIREDWTKQVPLKSMREKNMRVSILAELVGQAWTGIWLYFVLCHRCCPEGIPARYIFFPSPNQTTLKIPKEMLRYRDILAQLSLQHADSEARWCSNPGFSHFNLLLWAIPEFACQCICKMHIIRLPHKCRVA